MTLQTDDQTIEDLGLFGKRGGRGIYDIYNHSHTRGGEAVLRELFLKPLSDKESINQRRSIIEHFSELNLSFPFNASLFDMSEKYLIDTEGAGNQSPKKNMLSEKEIQNGVTAVIELMQKTKTFIEQKDIINITAYAQEREGMAALLTDQVFDPVLKEKLKGKLPYTAVAAYDALFRVREHDKIKKLLGYIYYLDVYISIARVALEKKFIFPQALDKQGCVLELKGVYHPELKTPVGNDLVMGPEQNLIFLTGANMAGKSTFLRAVSTAVYIAHMGFPVAAESMVFSVMDGLYTTVNLPDNLGIGASHFYTEVLRVKKMATELSRGKSLFIIFDELFRGTNVKDAHEATVAVTKAYAKKKSSLFIISSHIVEAGEELNQQPNIGFQYLPTHMNGHVPEYTYRLEKGITDDRHGMIIIRNEGILEMLEKGKKGSKAG